jgi:hypothetical protein
MIDAFGYSGERSLRLNHSDVARKRYADLRLSDSHWRDDEFYRELGENTVFPWRICPVAVHWTC